MSQFKLITLHWTAGGLKPNAEDKKHYHYLIDNEGTLHLGNYKPEDNLDTKTGYAAHVCGRNTGNIGIAVCGMCNYISPAYPGKFLINKTQIEKMCYTAAQLCVEYNLSWRDVRTHYELDREARIRIASGVANRWEKYRNKIDITYLPYEPTLDKEKIGDYLRDKVNWYMHKIKEGRK